VLRLIAARVAWAIPTLLLVVTISFFLMRAAPGGPFDLERPLDPAVMENLRRVYRLDDPLWRQYLDYLLALARGDLGPSYDWRDFTVAELLGKALPISAGLGALALGLAFVVGGAAGALAAARASSGVDTIVTATASLGVTLPNFVVAPLLQLVFGLGLKILPVGGYGEGAPRNLVLPVLVLAAPQIAAVARLTRARMIEALAAPASRTLRAYGLPRRVVLAHAFRAALIPLVSYLGPAAAAVMTGSVVVETIFGIPGVGRYFVEAALNRDYTLAMGTVLLVAIAILLVNLIVDVAYAFIDPRMRPE
jgi:oligopeptide transport system permease protein